MGTTLREVIYEIGGGCPNHKRFKAVQTGGPSGGCLTEEQLDTPIGFDELVKLGSMMGSGGMIVLDEDNCMVDVARFYMDFIVDESCGKCTPCRVGTKRMLELLEQICDGKGTMETLDELELLASTIQDTALCGLGQTAPNPVLSTIHQFRDEYIAHIVDKNVLLGYVKNYYNMKSMKINVVSVVFVLNNVQLEQSVVNLEKFHMLSIKKNVLNVVNVLKHATLM